MNSAVASHRRPEHPVADMFPERWSPRAMELGVPEDYQVEAMAAVGHPGRKEDLPKAAQDREYPSGRKRVGEFAFEGRFKH